jgi:hypothetical protein
VEFLDVESVGTHVPNSAKKVISNILDDFKKCWLLYCYPLTFSAFAQLAEGVDECLNHPNSKFGAYFLLPRFPNYCHH